MNIRCMKVFKNTINVYMFAYMSLCMCVFVQYVHVCACMYSVLTCKHVRACVSVRVFLCVCVSVHL